MKHTLALIIVLLLTSGGSAATIHVPDDYATIQAALDASVNGDTIIVRAGAYRENIDFLGKEVWLCSEAGSDYTTINGQQNGSGVTFQNGEGPGAVLEGFTITNGSGTIYSSSRTRGGGIYCTNGSSPVIRGNIFTDNFADAGGGISIDHAAASILDNVIEDNRAANRTYSMSAGGGGIHSYHSTALIQGNLITDNIVEGGNAFGGGIRGWYSSTTIKNNTLEFNLASSGGAVALDVDGTAGPSVIEYNVVTANRGDYGGAFSLAFDSTVVSANDIRTNWAEIGGAVSFYESAAELRNCMITLNAAHDSGGAMSCFDGSTPTIVNCTIAFNQAGLRGGAIQCAHETDPTVVNTILWANTAPIGPAIDLVGWPNTALTISYSAVQGGQSGVHVEPGATLNWGSGMISDDPLFAALLHNDYHLTFDSPCRNSGSAAAVPPDLLADNEGDARIYEGAPDMGADEFHPHLYTMGLADPGASMAIRVIGPPAAPVTLGLGSGVRPSPVPTSYGDIFLEQPIQTFTLGAINANGLLTYVSTVPGFWLPGDEKPLQALVGPLGGSGTVLSNLCVVVVE